MGEPNVIEYIPGVKIDEHELSSIAKDFGDFLLDIVEEEISSKANGCLNMTISIVYFYVQYIKRVSGVKCEMLNLK